MARRKKKNILFVDYFDQWVDTYKEGAVRDVTLAKYYMAGRHLEDICPSLLLDDLDRQEYQKILNEYAKTHERQTTMDFHHVIKGAILDAFHDGLLDRDPTYKAVIKGKPPKEKKRKYLHNEELHKLIKVLDIGTEINMDWFILLLAKTGLRFAEALAVTPDDFDSKTHMLNIDKTWSYKTTKGEFAPLKNDSSKRKIKIDWQIVGQFIPLIQDLPSDKPIFIKEGTRPFNSTFNNHLAKRCKEAGIPIITLHSLRHTHASVLLAAEVSLHSIAERLGHGDVSTTQETYTHIINELEEKDDQKMIGALMAFA